MSSPVSLFWKNLIPYYDSVRAEFKIIEMRGFISYIFTEIATVLTLCGKVSLEKEMAATSVFMPAESHGQSLVGYSL